MIERCWTWVPVAAVVAATVALAVLAALSSWPRGHRH